MEVRVVNLTTNQVRQGAAGARLGLTTYRRFGHILN